MSILLSVSVHSEGASSWLNKDAGLVVEDAPNGVRSGKAAGCAVLALLTTHSRSSLEDAKPDWIVKNLERSVGTAPSGDVASIDRLKAYRWRPELKELS